MRTAVFLFCLVTSHACLAQAAQTYTAARIQFNQPGSFTQQQLEEVAGMHAGAHFTAADLTAATQRISDSGYFDGVRAGVTGSTVQFDLQPTKPAALLPVGFENFVWLSQEEIEAAIRAKLPLFNGTLPENSPRQDDLQAALTSALAAKSITATVLCETYEPSLPHPVRAVGCRVVRPAIFVSDIRLTGVLRSLVPFVQKSVNTTARTAYTQGPANETTADRILAPLLDAGYIDAALSEIALTPSTPDAGKAGVVISAKLQAGEVFHVSSLSFAGTPLLSAEAFAASAQLHPGGIASRKALLATLNPLDAAYRQQGYMDVVVAAARTVDSATQQVAYTVRVVPGDQYRIHELTADGLDPAAKADFDRGFRMKAGDLYNPEYIVNFLRQNTALRALAGYSASFKSSADPNTHLVDVVITFFKMGS